MRAALARVWRGIIRAFTRWPAPWTWDARDHQLSIESALMSRESRIVRESVRDATCGRDHHG